MSVFSSISSPTLILDEQKAKNNLIAMVDKAKNQKVLLRPHFKTHQSEQIGNWFRDYGIQSITVSSVEMAEYFAEAGWKNILIAFPVNIRQMETITRLSRKINLGLLVESSEVIKNIQNFIKNPVKIWIKVDIGAGRTGVLWSDQDKIVSLVEQVVNADCLEYAGLLTHSGHTYKAKSVSEIHQIHSESLSRLLQIKKFIQKELKTESQISVGDTPASSALIDWGLIDEMRPGNFIFYDVQQYYLGVCKPEQVAVSLAAPVVSVHPEREEVVVYGGAVHLSKDYAIDPLGRQVFGLVCKPQNSEWSNPVPDAYVRALSQEHGIIHYPKNEIESIHPGDLLCVLPAHSCLTVQAMRSYITLDGEIVETMQSCNR